MPRLRFEVDYESPNEWGIGVIRDADEGATRASGVDVANALRAIAAGIERSGVGGLAIQYPNLMLESAPSFPPPPGPAARRPN